MDRCLLDTSTLSDVIRPASKRPATVARHLKAYLRAQGRLTISEMSCYEVLRGLRKKGASVQERQFVQFCQHVELLPVDFAVLDRAATLWAASRRIGQSVDDGDLIIVATALLHELPLVTANTRHFEWVEGVSLLNWRDP
jgi:predicted nucleic acid-binding protein